MGQNEELLNPEQKLFFEKMKNGENVFITGNAGTGKSFLVNVFREYCEANRKKIAVTAPTGIAALNVDGVTLHSFFRIPFGLDNILKTLTDEEFLNFKSGKSGKSGNPKEKKKTGTEKVFQILMKLDVLLIEEISMVNISMFDYVMQIIGYVNRERRLKKKKDIQLVMSGDFFQLPPVVPDEEKIHLCQFYRADVRNAYAFQSRYWRTYNVALCRLTRIMRQNDADFCKALDDCKEGRTECVEYFNTHFAKEIQPEAIWICGKNRTAEKRNQEELDRIDSPQLKSVADYQGECTKKDGLCLDNLVYKTGARVVMTVNSEDGRYCNGSLGTVSGTGNDKKGDFIEVRIDGSTEAVKVYRYKFSKHKYTQKKEEVPVLDRDGKPVADKDGNPKVKKEVRLAKEEIGSVMQFPMKLGYAVTIHKSQGQTYDAVNLTPEIFLDGQLYVALSRCRTVERICCMKPLQERMVKTCGDVLDYYRDPEHYSFFGTGNELSQRFLKNKYLPVIDELVQIMENLDEQYSGFNFEEYTLDRFVSEFVQSGFSQQDYPPYQQDYSYQPDYSTPYQQSYQSCQNYEPYQPFALQQGQKMAGTDTDWSRIINSSKPVSNPNPEQEKNTECFTDSLLPAEDDTWGLDFLS